MTEARRLGGFELHEKIGSGAMATVYRGVQLSLGRPVVLKIIHPHLAEDPGLVARFEREARAAAHLRHENIVQVIDCGKIEDTPFIAMEFVQGMDLKRLIETYGVPPVEMSILILRDLCRGLQHAHENGVIHRDIKPANLMITPTGTIKIMDFGLARRVEDSVAMTMAGSVMGTPAYMSPEQATGLKVDERSDLFTVGVVGYELLTGHRPFHGDTYSAVLNAILTQEPAPLKSVLPGVPEDLANLIHHALQKEPSARPAKIADLRDVLETLVVRLGLGRGEDLLRHYAASPDAVGEKLRHRAPGETVESILLGTVPRPAPDRTLVETRMGVESTTPPARTAPPTLPPATPPGPERGPQPEPAPPERPTTNGEAGPAATPTPARPEPRPGPATRPEPGRAGERGATGRTGGGPSLPVLIGGGVVVVVVAVVLGLQFLKPAPPVNGDAVERPAERTGTKPEIPKPDPPKPDVVTPEKEPDVDRKPIEKKPVEREPVVTPNEPKPKQPKPVPPKPTGTTETEKPKSGTRRYKITSRPNADITVDGRKIAFGDAVSLAPGVHRFRAVNPTMNLQGEFTYTVTADDTNNALILNLVENRLVARQVKDLPF